MRRIALALAVPLVAAACNWSKPAASPDNASDDSSDDTSDSTTSDKSDKKHDDVGTTTLDLNGASQVAPPPAQKATITDDTEKAEAPCSGKAIADLLAVASEADCQLPDNAPPAKQRPSKSVVDVKATIDSQVAPGGTAQVRIVYTNKTREPLPLDFRIDPVARVTFELYTSKGSRADKPAGAEPPLPADVSDAPAPEVHTARVTIGPRGTATLSVPWQAVRYKWASKEKAKGALPGRGYPREPAGPLPRGKYVLHVITPLTNLDEGADHELTQARLTFDVAGAPQAPPPPPAPAATEPAPQAPAQPPSNASLEEQFLKATSGPATASSGAAPTTTKKKKKKGH